MFAIIIVFSIKHVLLYAVTIKYFMVISLLPREVIERIAAGEVVTSPTALLKEVLENSLDSSATHIRVILTDKLLDCIVIEDNGSGIAKEDLALLCTRHATSKLSQHSDLEKINTLGFRGEALASISLLSNVSVRTSTHGATGYEAIYRNEEVLQQKEIACNKGTRLTINNLFYNAAEKYKQFINSKPEIAKIVNLITKYAIAYTEVSFEIVRSAEIKRYNTGNRTKISLLSEIFTQKLANELVFIPFTMQLSERPESIQCTLHVSHSNLSLSSPVFIMFVNRRLVEIQKIKKRIYSIYKEILVKGHPFILLEIELPQDMIDVNVHPSKVEVYLRKEEEIIEELEKRIREALQTKKMTGATKISYSQMSLREKEVKAPVQTKQIKDKEITIAPSTPSTPSSIRHLEIPGSQTPSRNTTPVAKRVRRDSKINPLTLFLTPDRSAQKPEITAARQCMPISPSVMSTSSAHRNINMPNMEDISINDGEPNSLTDSEITILKDSILIGMISQQWAAIQYCTDIYLLNIKYLKSAHTSSPSQQAIRGIAKIFREIEQIQRDISPNETEAESSATDLLGENVIQPASEAEIESSSPFTQNRLTQSSVSRSGLVRLTTMSELYQLFGR
ncbi:DNA mismatch repair protein MLH1 [Nematocida ausubeli]|nr:DNA mismatch repair protein MLH1 [Nematocida ausubeli]